LTQYLDIRLKARATDIDIAVPGDNWVVEKEKERKSGEISRVQERTSTTLEC